MRRDLQRGRRLQLRHARTRPADSPLRRRHVAGHTLARSPRAPGRDARDPRWRRARTGARRVGDLATPAKTASIVDGDDHVLGLAGIMGGAASEISDATTDVLLEAAYFDPMAIARSSKRHGLRSEGVKPIRTRRRSRARVCARRRASWRSLRESVPDLEWLARPSRRARRRTRTPDDRIRRTTTSSASRASSIERDDVRSISRGTATSSSREPMSRPRGDAPRVADLTYAKACAGRRRRHRGDCPALRLSPPATSHADLARTGRLNERQKSAPPPARRRRRRRRARGAGRRRSAVTPTSTFCIRASRAYASRTRSRPTSRSCARPCSPAWCAPGRRTSNADWRRGARASSASSSSIPSVDQTPRITRGGVGRDADSRAASRRTSDSPFVLGRPDDDAASAVALWHLVAGRLGLADVVVRSTSEAPAGLHPHARRRPGRPVERRRTSATWARSTPFPGARDRERFGVTSRRACSTSTSTRWSIPRVATRRRRFVRGAQSVSERRARSRLRHAARACTRRTSPLSCAGERPGRVGDAL